jgi:DNA-binding MarR family transcriptional regulator
MPASTPKGRLFHEIVAEVFRLRSALLAGSERVSATAGLTSARWQILGAIADAPATAAQVARRLGLTRQAVGETAEAMAREGLIAFLDDPAHRRARPMVLTARAQRALADLEPREAEFARRMGSPHTLAALRTTLDMLRRSRAALEAAPAMEEDA